MPDVSDLMPPEMLLQCTYMAALLDPSPEVVSDAACMLIGQMLAATAGSLTCGEMRSRGMDIALSADLLHSLAHSRGYGEIADEIESAVVVCSRVLLDPHHPVFSAPMEQDFAAVLRGVLGDPVPHKAAAVCTYVVRDRRAQRIKIGRSASPTARIHTLGLQSGHVLDVLRVYDYDCEVELHTQFAALRLHGEWFDDEGTIAAFVGEDHGPEVKHKAG
jgi:hypothetical protein